MDTCREILFLLFFLYDTCFGIDVIYDPQHRRQLKINWKLHEEMHSQDCSSLSELCQCEDSCKATFHASVGEIFLPITWVNLQETEAERMFISRRLHMLGQNSLVDDLITTGCQLCGTPVNGRLGYGQGLIIFGFFISLCWITALIKLTHLVLAGQMWSKTKFLYIVKEAQIVSM